MSWEHGPLCPPCLTSKKKLRTAEGSSVTRREKQSRVENIKETKATLSNVKTVKDTAVQHTDVSDEVKDEENVLKESNADNREGASEITDASVVKEMAADDKNDTGLSQGVINDSEEKKRDIEKEEVPENQQPDMSENGKFCLKN